MEFSLWEQMLSPENLGWALRRVEANRGAPGADGMTTGELCPWLREPWAQVRKAIRKVHRERSSSCSIRPQRGWAAAQHLAPCVLCHQPAILRSPRGKPRYWTCAMAWVSEHQDQDHERGQARAA